MSSVGIDLGTTYSAIARIDPRTEQASLLRDSQGRILTPSVVYFPEGGKPIAGWPAIEMARLEPERTARCFKYHMGREDYFLVFDNAMSEKSILPGSKSIHLVRQTVMTEFKKSDPIL